MSDIIHLLPDSVANQIAAGEVIQRPASIIKELVENSLDAGATRIQVLVTDAGKTCVQVIDNGKGMSATDARLSFERHATSKISSAADLFSLTTMGFRGEALASIAAVAQVELRTRMADEDLGVSIRIEGSKFIRQEPVACPVGANFSVKNLFYNIPARRKFLKSNNTENININTEFERIALAHPDISFSLGTPERVTLDLPASTFRQRIVNIFGRNIEKRLIPLQVETSVASVVGFIGTPESSKKRGAQQFFFVNGRYMRHPYFAKAVLSAYDRLIADGEQVPFFLQFVVDPSRIDVNIHPTKTEIKFEDEQAIWQVIRAAVREALGRFNAVPTIDFDTENRPDIPVFQADALPAGMPMTMPGIEVDTAYNPFADNDASTAHNQPSTPQRAAIDTHPHTSPTSSTVHTEHLKHWEALFAEASSTTDFIPKDFSYTTIIPPLEEEASLPEETMLFAHLDHEEQAAWSAHEAEVLQFRGRYLLTPMPQGLLVVDQHRAHIRILFEEYLEKVRQKVPLSQGLLFPQIIELSPSQLTALHSMKNELEYIGFEMSPLGGGSYSILALPSGVEEQDPVQLLQGIVDDALHQQQSAHQDILDTIALSVAKKAAIPPGKILTREEMRHLLKRLHTSKEQAFTPDGKRISHILSSTSLTRPFD